MILIAVICTNMYDYKTFIAGFQFAEGVNIQFKAVVTSHDAQGQNFAGYYLTPSAARRPDAEDLVALLDNRLRKVEAVLYDHGERAYLEGVTPDVDTLTDGPASENRRYLPYECKPYECKPSLPDRLQELEDAVKRQEIPQFHCPNQHPFK